MNEHKFKQSEIGFIPKDWELRNVGSNFDFIQNNTLSRECLTDNGKVINIHYGDVLIKYGANIEISKDEMTYINPNIRTKAIYNLRNGDIVMADTAEDEIVGKCCEIIASEGEEIEAGLHTFVLRPKNEYASKFLGYAFNAPCYHNQLLPHMQGTKVTSVSKAAVSKTYLLCPSVPEQRKIARVLSEIDKLICNINELLQKKRDITQGTMQRLLTGKQRLPSYAEYWKEYTFGEIGRFKGISINPQLSPDKLFFEYSMPSFDEGETPLLCKGTSMKSNRIAFDAPVLLVNKLNVRQKRIWLVEENKKNSICSGEFLPYVSDKASLAFIKYLLLLPKTISDFEDMSTGTSNSQKRITPKAFLDYTILLPPLDEQEAIASILSDMEKEILALETKRDKYISIKQGMMQDLLTGKIRLL